jgi:hypothetical protein
MNVCVNFHLFFSLYLIILSNFDYLQARRPTN